MVDYYSQGLPVEVKLVPKTETSVEIVDSQNTSEKQVYISYDEKISNRIIYNFNEKWNDENIKIVNLKFSNFTQNNLSFNSIEKAEFIREPVSFNNYFSINISFLNRVECFVHAVADLIVPRAQAFSCKASEASTVYFRTGTLVRVNLN